MFVKRSNFPTFGRFTPSGLYDFADKLQYPASPVSNVRDDVIEHQQVACGLIAPLQLRASKSWVMWSWLQPQKHRIKTNKTRLFLSQRKYYASKEARTAHGK